MGSSYVAVKVESEDSGDEMPETGLFREGEKVLAYHGPLIYDTKIQKAEFRKKEWKYFVHYLGWSKNWDEWVGADRLMKPTEENLEKQRKLFKNQTGDKQSKGRVPAGKQKSAAEKELRTESKSLATRGKKRKSAPVVESKNLVDPAHRLKISLPGTLKKQLVEDWEFITQMGKLVKLPRSPSAEEILKKYIDSKTKRDGAVEDSLVEVLSGLRSYFDKSLPVILLYPQERAQYACAVPQGSMISPSSIYGAEHLLRLFVKLSELLVSTNMEHEALLQLQQKLADFLKFLQRNQSNFFLSSYGNLESRLRNSFMTLARITHRGWQLRSTCHKGRATCILKLAKLLHPVKGHRRNVQTGGTNLKLQNWKGFLNFQFVNVVGFQSYGT